MQRLAVAVALLALLSGCSAFGPPEPAPDGTVTPVGVPDVAPAETPTATPDAQECLVPRPAPAPRQNLSTPAEPAPLPREGGTVNGSALVSEHVRTLADYSYHLHVEPSTDAWVMPRTAAFTYEGVALGLAAPWAYAVGGRLYTLQSDAGQLVLEERPYRLDSPANDRYRAALSGERWLRDRLGWLNYTVVDRRTHDGTEVRVLRDAREFPRLLGPDAPANGLLYVNSTVYVDRRGVVRYVRHRRHIEYAEGSGIPNQTQVGVLTVDQVGTANLHRPDPFCVTDPSAVVTPNTTGPGAPGAGETTSAATATSETDAVPPDSTTNATGTPPSPTTLPADEPTTAAAE